LVQDHEYIYPYYRLLEEGFEVTVALKEGVVCSDCVENGYSGGTLNFSVNGFSVYTTDETPVSSPASDGSSSGGWEFYC